VLVVVYRWRRWKRERSTEEPPRPAQMTTTPQAQGADPQAPSPPDSEALGGVRVPRGESPRKRATKGIFISYRRDESAGYAGRIGDSFQEHFGEEMVFRDVDSLEPGLDFAEAIERAVGSCEVLVAVIGKNWLTAEDAAGRRRLENASDYVRTEITAALQRDIRVVPLLVQGAAMPSADELPDDLAPLSRRNAFELHDTSWRDDVRRLTNALENAMGR
jgi:hypothetical protein